MEKRRVALASVFPEEGLTGEDLTGKRTESCSRMFPGWEKKLLVEVSWRLAGGRTDSSRCTEDGSGCFSQW